MLMLSFFFNIYNFLLCKERKRKNKKRIIIKDGLTLIIINKKK